MSYTAEFTINGTVSIGIMSESRESLISDLAAFGFQIGAADPNPPSKKQSAKATVASNGASSTPEFSHLSPADAAAQEPVEAAAVGAAPSTESDSARDGLTAAQASEALFGQHNGIAPERAAAIDAMSADEKRNAPEYKVIHTAVLDLVKSKGRDTAVGVLKAFNLGNATDAKVAQYADLLAALKKAGE